MPYPPIQGDPMDNALQEIADFGQLQSARNRIAELEFLATQDRELLKRTEAAALAVRERIAELERENAELRKDAARCDYLLRASFDDALLKRLEAANDNPANADEWRAAIDAAIASEKENERG